MEPELDLEALRHAALDFLRPDETALQLLARTWVQPLHTGLHLIDRHISLRGPQVLEVAGASGAGRTTALLHVAATCVLPQACGGSGGHVVYLDLDGKLDLARLLVVSVCVGGGDAWWCAGGVVGGDDSIVVCCTLPWSTRRPPPCARRSSARASSSSSSGSSSSRGI